MARKGEEIELADSTGKASRVLIALSMSALVLVCSNAPSLAEDKHEALDPTAMHQELARLATICDRVGLAAEANTCRTWEAPVRADQHNLYLPVAFPSATPDNAARAHWCESFATARRKHARWLYDEARRLADDGDERAAFQTLWHCLREDPEHTEALRVLGPLAGAAAVQPRIRSSATTQADFNWTAKSYSRIQTPHFLLTTRADARQSIAIAQRLEAAHALWCQVFFDVWAPAGTLQAKFDGEDRSWRETRKMEVFLLKDRGDYIQTLSAGEDNIGVSVGYYNSGAKKSFFYPSESLDATFFHELTHQLFSEASQLEVVPEAGSQGGLWLLEGIAVYMESLHDHESFWTLGGIEAPRMQTARYRAVRDGYWPNWQTFSGGTIDAWKSDPDVALNYAHAAGLTHAMLDLHPDRERTRASFMLALAGVYGGRRDAGVELRTLLGPDDEQAKVAYQDLLTATDEHLVALQLSGFKPRDLVLAGSELQRATWLGLSSQTELHWLDISFSNATNEDLTWIDQLMGIERLSVEGTRVNGSLLPMISRLRKLDELDLSGCAVDDAALMALRGNATIQTLWLTGTQVTAASLETLTSMRNLRSCDVSGTQIDSATWQAFEAKHLRAKP